ncbi:hypothetical protein LWI29_004011 [Acer saccharum]|uniref:Uncharacterized protein n=1 Tax=Acer saccharum TaxID=4024 RepID=A0AA39T724_ACESA|nr:hypothetical protein LWI29_004011 [Acer saccharum]
MSSLQLPLFFHLVMVSPLILVQFLIVLHDPLTLWSQGRRLAVLTHFVHCADSARTRHHLDSRIVKEERV